MSQQYVIRHTSPYSDRVVYLGGCGVVPLIRDARRFGLLADADGTRLIYAEGLAAAQGIGLPEAKRQYDVIEVAPELMGVAS